jgi:nucleotide-binding universal stress UspA family protein
MKAETSRLLAGAPAALPLEHDLLRGPLEDKLVEYVASANVDLMLVGHRRNHPLRRSLARQLTKLAPSSILMVPEGSPAAIRRILAPIDFSPPSAQALAAAVNLAAAVGLKELTALHVYFNETRTTYEGADRSFRGDELAHFNAFVAPLDKQGVAIQPLFREGVHPAHTIGQVAQELAIDLTIMETRGRSPSAAILLGSVAEETLAESANPVLVVKDSRKQIGLLRALLLKLTQREPGM